VVAFRAGRVPGDRQTGIFPLFFLLAGNSNVPYRATEGRRINGDPDQDVRTDLRGQDDPATQKVPLLPPFSQSRPPNGKAPPPLGGGRGKPGLAPRPAAGGIPTTNVGMTRGLGCAREPETATELVLILEKRITTRATRRQSRAGGELRASAAPGIMLWIIGDFG
jgi:hypothetical protein